MNKFNDRDATFIAGLFDGACVAGAFNSVKALNNGLTLGYISRPGYITGMATSLVGAVGMVIGGHIAISRALEDRDWKEIEKNLKSKTEKKDETKKEES